MKTRKIAAGAMSFIFAVLGTTSMLTASAEDATVKVSGDKVEATAGEEFTLNISLSGVPSTGIKACEFALSYDSDLVTVTGVTAGAATETGADANESTGSEAPAFGVNYDTAGKIYVDWSTGLSDSSYWIKSDGVFLTIKGTVSESAKAGDSTEFTLGGIDRETYEGSGVTTSDVVFATYSGTTWTECAYDADNGSVTITDGSSEGTTSANTEGTTEKSTSGETASVDSSLLYGDTNTDGNVTISDVVLLNKSLVGNTKLSSKGEAQADAYLDGTVDVNDSVAILQYNVTVVESLPVIPD